MKAMPVPENPEAKEAALHRALAQGAPPAQQSLARKFRLTIVGLVALTATALSPVGPAVAEWIDGVADSDSGTEVADRALIINTLADEGDTSGDSTMTFDEAFNEGKPAEECPQAQDEYADAGLQVDVFLGGCPEPGSAPSPGDAPTTDVGQAAQGVRR